MDERGLGGPGAPIELSFVSGGTQNEIYEVRRGDLHGALRIPPPEAPESRDAGILREWRIIDALGGTDVPHTRAIAACEDAGVLGRGLLPHGLRRRLVADGRRRLAVTVRHRPRGPTGPRRTSWSRASPCCRRSTGRPGDSPTSAGPRASTSGRSTAGRRSSSASRAASSPVSTRRPPGSGRTSRSTTSPASCTATTSSPT